MKNRALYTCVVLLTTILGASPVAFAATFQVANAAGLQTAIQTANTNNEDDTIVVTANILLTTTPYSQKGPNALPPIQSDNGHTLTIKGGQERTITFDKGNDPGRLFYVGYQSKLILEDLYLTGGNAATGTIDNDRGGAIYVEDGRLTLRNCRLYGNLAASSGGALFAEDGIVAATDSYFTDNIANGKKLDTVNGIIRTFNHRGGGGITAVYSQLDLTNCNFLRNDAPNGNGAGVNVLGDFSVTASIKQCTFRDNDAYDGGGLAHFDGPITIDSCLFENNTGDWGGGIHFSHDFASNVAHPTFNVKNTTFKKNQATLSFGFGGGVFNQNSSVHITDCHFEENSADGGGGVFIFGYRGNASLTMDNCTLIRNRSMAYNGSAVRSDTATGTATFSLNNCTIAHNEDIQSYGAVCTSGEANVTNCTFYNNYYYDFNDYGGDLYNDNGGTIRARNCIFAGASETHFINFGTFISLGNNISAGSESLLNHATDLQRTNPLLDPDGLQDNGGPTLTIALLPNSPAINRITGTPGVAFTATDQRGVARPNRGKADSGAFEAILNTAPEAGNDNATTAFNQAVTITVKTNDTDADGDTLTVTGVTQPANGTATINGDGTITYTPNTGFSSTDTFTYTISDGQGGTASASVVVTVQAPIGPAKILLGDAVLVRSGDTITAQVTLTNSGGSAATNLQLQEAILGTTVTSTAPMPTVTNLAPGASTTVTLTFPATAGNTGQSVFLKVKGTFTGGSFNCSRRVSLP